LLYNSKGYKTEAIVTEQSLKLLHATRNSN